MPTLQEKKKRQEYIAKANQTEEKYGLPKNILVGLIGAESNFNPYAVNKHSNASGIAQFMKGTAQEYGINPFNPSESIDAAGKYLASSYKKFGNIEDALMSYNMGVGGLQKVKAGKKRLPKETAEYVGRVYKNAGIEYEEPSYANSVAPYLNEQPTPTINYLEIPQNTPTFASAPTPEKEEETDPEVQKVEQESNFLREIEKEDYAHLQPQQRIQQQETRQTDYMQQYEQIGQFLGEGNQVAQQGRKFKLQDERNLVQRDNTPNTKRDLSLMLAEYKNAKKDEQEFRTTGQIKNPSSIQYRRNIKTQPEIKQDNISTEQRNEQLNPLQRPLIYLANPDKALGDLGVPGMQTSELDRQAINANRFNPNQSNTDRFINHVKIGLGYVPEATINTALAAAFMPEGSGALGLVNEALNPLAGLKTSIPDELRQGLRTNGFSNQLPPPPSELHIPISDNTINLRRDGWNGIIQGRKRRVPTILDEILDTKFIPGVKKRVLPENLNPVITELEDRLRIELMGEDNLSRASLTLKEKRNWNIGDDGKIVMDEAGNPTQKPKEWMSPEMIYVNPELQGNRTQDLLYHLGIEEAKKKKLKGIYSGETLLSPEKTKKVHERFDKEVFKERVAPPSYNRNGTELIDYNEVGLTSAKNTKLQEEWLERYNKLNKFKREKMSIKELSQEPSFVVPTVSFASLGAGAFGLKKYQDYEEERNKDFLKAQQEDNKQGQNKQQGGQQKYTDNEIAFISEIAIKDQEGQRNHPNKVIEIQGNTMSTHGYGDIPLFVIPNKGKARVINANTGQHKFKGATKFLEIPIKNTK